MESTRKRDYLYWGIIVILIVVILSLVSCSRIGKIDNQARPTGNVDIFNIGVDCDCDNPIPSACDVDDDKKDDNNKNENKSGNKENKKNTNKDVNEGSGIITNNEDVNNNGIPIYNPDEDDEELDQVFVDDVNGNYIYQNNLDIFVNQAYEYTNKIAPGVSNSYDFVVHNENSSAIIYKMTITEESEFFVNLKYRLHKNGSYLIGDDSTWVSADELSTSMAQLTGSSDDNYRLDWKWFDHPDDTEAGEEMTSAYKLKVRFDFELDA